MDHNIEFKIAGVTFKPTQRQVVLNNGEIAKLRPKEAQVFTVLIEQYPEVVSRGELEKIVWPGVLVTDNAVNQVIKDLRKSIGGSICDAIKTIPRRGYQLGIIPEKVEKKNIATATDHPLTAAPLISTNLEAISQLQKRAFIFLSVLLTIILLVVFYVSKKYISVNVIDWQNSVLPIYANHDLVDQVPATAITKNTFYVKTINEKKVTCVFYKGGTLCKPLN